MKYRKGYDYQLAEQEVYQTSLRPEKDIITHFISLDLDGILIISAGYAWDGPSGPTLNTDNSMTPSLVHDASYQLIRMSLLDPRWRKELDVQLYLMLRERGMSWFRARYWLTGVRWFAGGAATPGQTRQVFEVA